MGSSSAMENRSSILAVLVLAMGLLCGSASGSQSCVLREEAIAALRIENNLADGANLTLLNPPGCCNYCTGEICPAVCEPCKSVVVENGKQVTLEANVGPYPLESLNLEVGGGDVYCPAEKENLQRLTATALLQVGPGVGCEEGWPSISGRIVDDAVPGPPDSGRFEICLRLCRSTMG